MLKRHTDEMARRQNIATMGVDLTPPASKLKVTPITGNDIFGSRAQALAPTFTPPIVDEGTSHPSPFAALPPPVTPLPHFVQSHSIEDDDFPPDPVEHANAPPEVLDPPDCYPSMEVPDADTDEDEPRGRNEAQGEDEPDLQRFLDWEYLKQGNYRPIHGTYQIRANNLVRQPTTSQNSSSQSVAPLHSSSVPSFPTIISK